MHHTFPLSFSLSRWLISCTALLAFSSHSLGDVLLELGDNITLLAENEKVINKLYSPLTDDGRIRLPNGVNQILVQHTAEIEDDNDTVYENTHTFVVLFSSENTELRLTAPKLTSERALRQFNNKPKWTLKDAQGQSIAFETDALKFDGLQLGRNYAQELIQFNLAAKSPAAARISQPIAPARPTTYAQQNTQANTANTAPQAPAANSIAYDNLVYWYQQATPDIRERFKQFIAQ